MSVVRVPADVYRWAQVARACLGLILAALASVVAAQVDIPNRRNSFTPGELASLPPYCQHMQGMPGYEGAPGNYWRQVMGDAFAGIHHYCRGLRDIYYVKLLALKPRDRYFLWERAINEFDYIIKNSKPSMVLMPEVYFRKGDALMKIGRVFEARDAFEASRKAKPDYWPAYVGWADYLRSLKQFDDARELLAAGFRHAPGSKEIRDRLAALPGGQAVIDSVTAARAMDLPASAPASVATQAAPARASALDKPEPAASSSASTTP